MGKNSIVVLVPKAKVSTKNYESHPYRKNLLLISPSTVRLNADSEFLNDRRNVFLEPVIIRKQNW